MTRIFPFFLVVVVLLVLMMGWMGCDTGGVEPPPPPPPAPPVDTAPEVKLEARLPDYVYQAGDSATVILSVSDTSGLASLRLTNADGAVKFSAESIGQDSFSAEVTFMITGLADRTLTLEAVDENGTEARQEFPVLNVEEYVFIFHATSPGSEDLKYYRSGFSLIGETQEPVSYSEIVGFADHTPLPNGKQYVFQDRGTHCEWSLYIATLKPGGESREFPLRDCRYKSFNAISWPAPGNGEWMVFAGHDPNSQAAQVWAARTDGSKLVQLTTYECQPGLPELPCYTSGSFPVLSQYGQYVYVNRWQITEERESLKLVLKVNIVNPDDITVIAKDTANFFLYDITTDGRTLLFRKDGAMGFLDTQTGEWKLHPLFPFPQAVFVDPAKADYLLSPALDNEHGYLQVVERYSTQVVERIHFPGLVIYQGPKMVPHPWPVGKWKTYR